MDQELKNMFDQQNVKIDTIYTSVEKTRKYFKITMWITILAVLLPLIGLLFAIPSFLTNYVGGINSAL